MAVKKSELYSMLFEACNKLRGGVEPARYKDYVLILLFFKYVSDRYKGEKFGTFKVEENYTFDDLKEIKYTPDIGERVDTIIAHFLEANNLQGYLPDVSFNNHDELGNGKELIDKVSGLIAVFENPAIDFRTNRASGDDIIGDAYEYFMMKFAQESGKSKGQFYTPSEVSRIIARLIGIGDIKPTKEKNSWTLYDPAAGSGSLLIRAADEAPTDSQGHSIVSIRGQEKDNSTAGLAKMNFVLHQKDDAVIERGNTLAAPAYTDHDQLEKFDFIVMNPPFSDKSWSDGIDLPDDTYKRFSGYAIPPLKNGDYAWFLHVLKSLKSNGRAGIILPHGVLFRGNSEETIRKKIIGKHFIKGIISLPPNLFYGTGIPACIIIIDKRDAEERKGIFLIDASQGFKKDGNKNRLREQDIEKIVRVFLAQEEIEGYSRFVEFDEILQDNEGNLNISRYVQRPSKTLPQNIAAHLNGGVPGSDIATLHVLWKISPELQEAILSNLDPVHDTFMLALPSEEIEDVIRHNSEIQKVVEAESQALFACWEDSVKESLLNIDASTEPKRLIRNISSKLLSEYQDAVLVDAYDVYDCLLNYWNEKLQDDVYAIKASDYEAGREIEYVYGTKKVKENGQTITVEDKSKVKSFDGLIIPRDIIESTYFSEELAEINVLLDEAEQISAKLDEIREEESCDEGLLTEVLNEAGDAIPKAKLNARIKELDGIRTSSEIAVLNQLIKLLDEGNTSQMEGVLASHPEINDEVLRNKNGTFGKTKLKAALKEAEQNAPVPEIYLDEYNALISYRDRLTLKDDAEKVAKEKRKELDALVEEKYGELAIDEIKTLLFDKKWMPRLQTDISNEVDAVVRLLTSRLIAIARRYEHTLGEIETKVDASRAAARDALERMGYTW